MKKMNFKQDDTHVEQMKGKKLNKKIKNKAIFSKKQKNKLLTHKVNN